MAEREGQDKMTRRMNYLRLVVGLIFVVSGMANVYTAATNPEEYRSFSETALVQAYRDLIDSVSTSLMPILLALVGVYEFALGALMLSKGFNVKVGLVMGIVFALAISMLGVDELAALAFIPLFVFMLTKDFGQSAFGSFRSRRAVGVPT